MLRRGSRNLPAIEWPKAVCADLRKFLLQILERHIEKKLVTAGMLEKIGSRVRPIMANVRHLNSAMLNVELDVVILRGSATNLQPEDDES